MSHDVLSLADTPAGDVSHGLGVDEVSPGVPAIESAAEIASTEPAEAVPPVDNSADRRAAVLAAVRGARDLPPGVRERLTTLVEHAATLDLSGDPLLSTRQVLELLSQGLPPVLRRETSAAVERPAHPTGDAFFAANSDELSDQQAEQIARLQLQRAGLLRAA